MLQRNQCREHRYRVLLTIRQLQRLSRKVVGRTRCVLLAARQFWNLVKKTAMLFLHICASDSVSPANDCVNAAFGSTRDAS